MADSQTYKGIIDALADFPHCQRAAQYAVDAVSGCIPARDGRPERPTSELERKACQRFLDDLTGKSKMSKRFFFDPERGERICRFAERMPHVKGRWAAKRETFTVEPWQAFFFINIFGWVDDDGLRRFQTVYLKVPRKNGKSFKAATIGNYMFAADGEYGAEVYCGATSEKQAWEVFGPAKKMAELADGFVDHYGVSIRARSMLIEETLSKFEPVIGKPGDGSNPHCAIADELHEHDTDDFVSTMKTGMGAREQPLLLQITTAGSNIASICYDVELDAVGLLNGAFEDDRFFALVYGVDPEDDWTTEEALAKANPNIGVSVTPEWLRQQQIEAERSAAKQNAFKRKHLNIWVGAHAAWMNMEAFSKCKRDFEDADFIDGEWAAMPCVIPIDLASRIDLTAVLRVFYRIGDDGKIFYKVRTRFYLPEETIYDEKNAHYQKWHAEGHLIATAGNELDFSLIRGDVEKDLSRFNVTEITYDPWRAVQLAQELQADGARVVEFRNTVQNMSPAMYELEAAIYSGRFEYDGNPIFEWMMGNVVARIDAKDNIYPRKQKPEAKIDGAVATIMAVGRIMEIAGPEDAGSTPGVFFL